MKQKLLALTTVILLALFSVNASSQTPARNRATAKTQSAPVKSYQKRFVDTAKNTDFSLNGQYRFMLSRSRSSFGSKLINPVRLDAVWKSVSDTLSKERTELKNAKTKVAEQEKTIASLNAKISGKESTLSDTAAKADEINFLGIPFTKGSYQITVWSIIVVLAIALFVVIARSSKNILETKYRTQLYDEISAEFQAYKSKSNEQQRKLARELQDERNIVEEMKSKGK